MLDGESAIKCSHKNELQIEAPLSTRYKEQWKADSFVEQKSNKKKRYIIYSSKRGWYFFATKGSK
jgi:hypothetical protein